MNDLAKKLGPKLAELRDSRRITQEKLEELSGVPRRTIQNIEHGQTRDPGIETVSKLLEALAYTWDDLLAPAPSIPISFDSAATFLAKFEGLPLERRAFVLSVVYNDPDLYLSLQGGTIAQSEAAKGKPLKKHKR